MAEAPHPAHPLAADVTRKQRAEPVPPQPHRLVAEVDPALMLDGPTFEALPDAPLASAIDI
jgi:hypothetical protein